MGATGRNILKFIGGSAIGAGVGALLARGTENAAKPAVTVVVDPVTTETAGIGVTTAPPAATHEDGIGGKVESFKNDVTGKVTGYRDALRDRWERAQREGDKAKEEREAELRAYFREKVNDPTAFPPGAPTRQDR